MPGRTAHLWTVVIVLVAVAVVVAVAAPAQAQDRTPTPSAQELWRDYPLRHRKPAPQPAGAPARTPAASRPVAAVDAGGADPLLVPVLAMAFLVAAGTGAALLVRRRRSRSRTFAMPLAAAPRLALVGPSPGSHRLLLSRAAQDEPQSAARSEPPRQSPGVRPPDPDRRWTAEIQWARSEDTARFCVVARDEQGESEPVIARSEPFDWPPEGTDAVQALVGAADALCEGLTVAGWNRLPRGEAWYAKRFQWEPAPVADWAPPRPPTNRFRPTSEWPPGTEERSRCEITWRSGYARSRFEVVMHDPSGERDDRVVATSPPFKWLFTGDPNPNDVTFREAALDLAATLESAGWERVGVGAAWYAARFVWHGDGPPPDEILVAPARTRSAP